MNPNCPPETHPFTNRWLHFNEATLTPEASAAWVTNQEKGYFGFLPNRGIKHLIIGSFPIWESVHYTPPHDRFDFAFFYCSRVNRFFKFLETLSGYNFFPNPLQTTPHQKVQFITDFFLQKQLGITDVIGKVRRTDANCKSALDNDLSPLIYNDLCQLLSDYPEVTHLYFTSGYVGGLCMRQLRKCSVRRAVNTSTLFSPGPASNTAAAGIINRDERDYGLDNSLRFHMPQIPIIQHLTAEVDRLKVSKWAKRLRNVPDLARPEILNHPNFIAIENRL